jgi:N-acetyl-alpha-D-muramate 1-phosphate uridylyltransferase
VPATAMVMAAGMGTRMRPLTDKLPKPLVAVAGTTLLDHVLNHLRCAGVSRVVVNVHYLAELIEAHLTAHAADLEVMISDERAALLETGGGLMRAKPLLNTDPFLCVNTDNVWTDVGENSLKRLAAHWDADRMDVLMLVVPFSRATHYAGRGDFDMGPDGRLSRTVPERAKDWVWTGIQILSQRILVDPPADAFSTNIFWNRSIERGRVFGVEHLGQWFDVGTPAAIPKTEAALAHE